MAITATTPNAAHVAQEVLLLFRSCSGVLMPTYNFFLPLLSV